MLTLRRLKLLLILKMFHLWQLWQNKIRIKLRMTNEHLSFSAFPILIIIDD